MEWRKWHVISLLKKGMAEQMECSYIAGGRVHWYNHFGNLFDWFYFNVQINSKYPAEMCIGVQG